MRILRDAYEDLPSLLASESGPEGSATKEFERRTWRSLDYLEMLLLALAGLLLATFTFAVFADVVTRMIGLSVTWLQQLILGAFVWGLFLGGSVAARRRLHFRLTVGVDSMTGRRRKVRETVNHGVVLVVAIWLMIFGLQNLLMGTTIWLQPTGLPVAFMTAAVPTGGVMVALFTVEALVTGWIRGFEDPRLDRDEPTVGTPSDPLTDAEGGRHHE